MENCDLFIVGAGAAGLSAARAAAEQGCGSIMLADRMTEPGGILRQCIHRGFGSEQTGPEYISELMKEYPQNVCFLWNTTVISVDEHRKALISSPDFGLKEIRFRQMIFAAGCREIPSGSLDVSGTRPEGVCTAGELQRDMNLHGIIPEGPAVILGSGDVGLVMAWQLLKAGIEVRALIEKQEMCGGTARNWDRLEGYKLTVRTGCTVSKLLGEGKLTGVNIRELKNEKEEVISCKTLVIAAGLIPENGLIKRLAPQSWLHLCGNCRSIHAVVEGVVQEGIQAGIAACLKLREET